MPELINFKLKEFACRCGCDSDGSEMDGSLLEALQDIRTAAGFPFFISSGYRCPKHPVEAVKTAPGAHSQGIAVDILVSGENALTILKLALNDGRIKGVGVHQKGGGRFIHLDTRETPAIWSY